MHVLMLLQQKVSDDSIALEYESLFCQGPAIIVWLGFNIIVLIFTLIFIVSLIILFPPYRTFKQCFASHTPGAWKTLILFHNCLSFVPFQSWGHQIFQGFRFPLQSFPIMSTSAAGLVTLYFLVSSSPFIYLSISGYNLAMRHGLSNCFGGQAQHPIPAKIPSEPV